MKTFTVACCLIAVTLLLGCEPPRSSKKKQEEAAAAAQAAAEPAPVETEQVKAGVGVGIKGRSLDEYEGVVVTPAKTLFAFKERAVFDIQIPQALDLYKASEGQAPQTHDEFMEKIVQFNNIPLPQLPEGHRYVYDPATEQLMVERPKKKSEPAPGEGN